MKMTIFVKKMFLIGLTILSGLTNTNSLSFISMNNEECKRRSQIVNVNGDEPVFFPFRIKTSKCSGSCNNINYPFAKIYVPGFVKNLNVKLFNLMSRTNEQDTQNDMKCVNVSVNLGLMFVIINNVGIKINADVNVKN